jgi:predicted dehydrogenase
MRRIRLGMVGGGQGAFIGGVHRIAARLDDQFTLLAGALSSDPARAHASALEINLDPSRSYDTYMQMFEAEALRPDGIEAVTIVTPNHLHAPVARAALAAGLHVICDKPLTTTVAEADELVGLAGAGSRVFAVTYNYSGHPMVRQARAMVAAGLLGTLRVVQVQYAQAWLADALEDTGQKQAAWRTDPARTGAGGAIGDIGTHAFHLAGFVSGLAPDAILADMRSFVAGRRVDDNAQVLLRYPGGARGMLWASQVAHGHENDLRLSLYGTSGGLSWSQEAPDRLWFTPTGQETRLITRGSPAMGPDAARLSRLPAGHPEGYLEAFAGIYAEIARAIRGDAGAVLFPTVADGAAGVRFVDAAVRSSASGGTWMSLA